MFGVIPSFKIEKDFTTIIMNGWFEVELTGDSRFCLVSNIETGHNFVTGFYVWIYPSKWTLGKYAFSIKTFWNIVDINHYDTGLSATEFRVKKSVWISFFWKTFDNTYL